MALSTVWYLGPEDVTPFNGGTWIVPRSHLDPRNPVELHDDIPIDKPIPGEIQISGPAGSVVIIDDVVTVGTSVGEAIEIIESAGAQPTALVIALDRQEKTSENGPSAVQDIRDRFGLKVHTIARFSELIEYLRTTPDLNNQVTTLEAYRDRYGIVGE